MTAVVWPSKCRGEIIVRNDRNKNKNVKSRNKIENKDRNNIKKSFNRKVKIIDKDNKKKCKNRTTNTKSYNKVGDRDRNNINIELNEDNIYKKILYKNRANNRDVGF